MCFESDGYAEMYSESVATARKDHKCTECWSVIAKGEKYHRHSGKFDGHFFSEKVCRRCDYDRIRIVEHELVEGCHWSEAWCPFGELVDYLHDSDMGQTRPEDVPISFQVGDKPKTPIKEPAPCSPEP